MAVSVTHVFQAGDPISASELNENFNDLEAGLNGALDSTSLAAAAGIKATQLSDRFSIYEVVFPLVDFLRPSADAGDGNAQLISTTNTGDRYNLQGTMDSGVFQTVARRRFSFDAEAYLVEVELYVAEVADTPKFRLRKNGNIVGLAAVDLDTSDSYYRIRNAGLFDAPLESLTDGDELTYEFASTTTTNASARGILVREVYKVRLTN